jgi:hypothetical protein
VDLFSKDNHKDRVSAAAEALASLLTGGDGDIGPGDLGADQGLGVTNRSVLGFLFWVRADDVGAAAAIAVDTAQRAGASCGAGPELYDVTVIPRDAVVLPEPNYPSMPD